MKVISYNRRGLGSAAKKAELRELTNKEKGDVIFVQETKISGMKENDVYKLGGSKEWIGVTKDAEGRSGGLLVLWNSNVLKLRSSWDAQER